MPIDLPLPPTVQGYEPTPAPIQQGFGYVTTLYHPFFTNINYPVVSSIGSFNYYGTTIPKTSSVGVLDYNNHSFQAFVTGSGNFTSSITVQSSIDGLNWNSLLSFSAMTSSGSVSHLTGRYNYFQASVSSSGNVTSSLYLISGE
jgi:hypothetical protein